MQSKIECVQIAFGCRGRDSEQRWVGTAKSRDRERKEISRGQVYEGKRGEEVGVVQTCIFAFACEDDGHGRVSDGEGGCENDMYARASASSVVASLKTAHTARVVPANVRRRVRVAPALQMWTQTHEGGICDWESGIGS